MGRRLCARALVGGILLLTAALYRDVAASPPPSLPPSAQAEPITGTPAVSAPGGATRRHDPFKPYDTGPPGSTWTYKQLPPAQRAYVDQAGQHGPTQHTLDGFAHAAAERAHEAAGEAAAHELGVEDLASLGVVP